MRRQCKGTIAALQASAAKLHAENSSLKREVADKQRIIVRILEFFGLESLA